MRWRVSDTPIYTEIEEQGAVATAPARSPRRSCATCARRYSLSAGTLFNTVAYYIALIYMTNYVVTVGKLPQSYALWISTGSLAVMIALLLRPRRALRPGFRATAADARLLPCLYRTRLSVLSPGVVRQPGADDYRAAVDAGVLRALRRHLRVVPHRNHSDPGALYLDVGRRYNCAVALFGGFAPFIATWLVRETGSPYAPAVYLIGSAIITGAVVLRTRETAFTPLS